MMKIPRRIKFVVLLLLAMLLPATLASQETGSADLLITDYAGFQVPEGWEHTLSATLEEYLRSRQNTSIPALGISRNAAGVFCFHYSEAAKTIPVISLTFHPRAHLDFSEEGKAYVKDHLERLYSEETGTPFRSFILEESSVDGVRAYRLIGVYQWRTNNVKIEQYLVPGAEGLFAITYTNMERDFSSLEPDFNTFLESVEIDGPAFYLDWFGTFASGLMTVGIIAAVLFGIYFIYSIRPAGGGNPFRFPGSGTRDGDDGRSNPFLRK